ncbi:class I SAM-dependent methyltransferase [Patulibacter brassicae]|uniref:Class I SAM-dependent methyltransferase n=1 Tax=Patulibacter brassicae TaxID=1705717 RepID=A0ABU4VLT9_9ACTN|nr:class I SAM-dependent methyltransferase [Patulibacter brassicae]MDX8152817.1 class I SAM-dependent methyltransferase [Patulibacter brassicae]
MSTVDYSAIYDPDTDFDLHYTRATGERIRSWLRPGESVLELGCATGAMTALLVGDGRQVVAVDQAERYLERVSARHLVGVEVRRGDLDRPLAGVGHFDHVVLTNVLHELDDPVGLLRRIAAAHLFPGGLLHLSLQNPRSIHRLVALEMGIIEDLHEVAEAGRRYATRRLYDADELAGLAEQAGLEVLHREGVMLKPLANRQMATLDPAVLEGFVAAARHLPDHGAMNLLVLRRRGGTPPALPALEHPAPPAARHVPADGDVAPGIRPRIPADVGPRATRPEAGTMIPGPRPIGTADRATPVVAVPPVERRPERPERPAPTTPRPPEGRRRDIVGGTLAALVAADAAASRGESVRLLLPRQGVGGGFAPIRRDGHVLELGVRLLELGFEGAPAEPPPLREYRPGLAGHRPWATTVERWARELLGDRIRTIAPPVMVLRDAGRITREPDLLFTVDLSALATSLPDAVRRRMLDEVRHARATTGEDAGLLAPRHAERLAGATLLEASLANHGPTFHERYVAPLCDKVLGGGAASIAATLRRKAWAPLFHPRTLEQALAGDPIGFHPQRPLETVDPDGCGGVVDALLERLDRRTTLQVMTVGEPVAIAPADRGRTAIRFEDGRSILTRRPLLACSAATLFRATGIAYDPPRVRTAIAWLDAPTRDVADVPELVHVLDPANPVLRVSRGGRSADPERALLTVELRHDTSAEGLVPRARDGLVAAGLVDPTTARSLRPLLAAARPTFPVPSAEVAAIDAAARAELDRLRLDVDLAAGAASAVADTLNDQVVQGLQAAARIAT